MAFRVASLIVSVALAGSSVFAQSQKPDPPVWYQDANTAPTIYFVSSDDVPPGAYLAIFGDDFGGAGSVTLGTATATIVSWSDRKVVVTVPSGASGPVVVTPNGGSPSNAFPLAVRSGRVLHLDGAAPAGGDGSAARPWNSFATANSNVRPGDFVVVHAGTYVGSGDAVWSATTSGAQGNSITWFARPGDYVFVDGSTTGKEAIRIDAADVNVVGFVANGGQYQNILLNGLRSRAIDNEAKNGNGATTTKGQGINLNADYTKAFGNYVHDNYSHGFYVHANNMEIGYNYVSNSGCCGAPSQYGYGIQVYMNPGATFTGTKVYRNYVTTSNRSGIVIGQYADTSDVFENVVTNNKERCIIVNYGATKTTIRNNVCYHNDPAAAGYYEIDLYQGTDADVFNNAISGVFGIARRSGMAGTIAIDSNIFDGTARWTWDTTNYGTLSTWRSGTGKDANSQAASPAYASPASNDFRPGQGSPMVDAGNDANCARPILGAHCDEGAFESGSGGSSNQAPATPANLHRIDKQAAP